MPQYLVTGYLPDNYDPSAEDEAKVKEIHALNREMIAAGVRKFACGLARSLSEKYFAIHLKPELSRSTNFGEKPAHLRGGGPNCPRSAWSRDFGEKGLLTVSSGLQDRVQSENVMREAHQRPLPPL